MPQLTAITVDDGATTPVPHVFSPVTTNGWLAELQERTGIPKGQASLSISVRPSSSNTPMYKVRMQIRVPSLVTDGDGRQVVAYTNMATIEFLTHEEATLQNRKDILAFVKNLLVDSSVVTVAQNLEPLY